MMTIIQHHSVFPYHCHLLVVNEGIVRMSGFSGAILWRLIEALASEGLNFLPIPRVILVTTLSYLMYNYRFESDYLSF